MNMKKPKLKCNAIYIYSNKKGIFRYKPNKTCTGLTLKTTKH